MAKGNNRRSHSNQQNQQQHHAPAVASTTTSTAKDKSTTARSSSPFSIVANGSQSSTSSTTIQDSQTLSFEQFSRELASELSLPNLLSTTIPPDIRAAIDRLQREIFNITMTLSMTRKAGTQLVDVGMQLESEKKLAEQDLSIAKHKLTLLDAEAVDLRKACKDSRSTLGSMRSELQLAREELKFRRAIESDLVATKTKFNTSMASMEQECEKLRKDCSQLKEHNDQLLAQLKAAKKTLENAEKTLSASARAVPPMKPNAPYPPPATSKPIPPPPAAAAAAASMVPAANGSTTAVVDDGSSEEDGSEYEGEDDEGSPKSYNDLARDFLRSLEIKDYAGFCSNVAHLVVHEHAQHVNDWNALALGALWLIALAGDCHAHAHLHDVIESVPEVRKQHPWVIQVSLLHDHVVANEPREFFKSLDLVNASHMVKQVAPLRDLLNALRILQRIRFLNAFFTTDNRFKRSNQVSLRMALFKTDFKDTPQLKQWLERELEGSDTQLMLTGGGKNLGDVRTLKTKLHDKLKGAENTYRKALDYLNTALVPLRPGQTMGK